MSYIDKQMLLRDLESKLGAFVPANDIHRILIAADEALANYNVTSAPDGDGGFDDSRDLLKYFIEAKRIEGKSEKTVERYEYLLNRFLQDTKVPFAKVTVYHIREYLTSEKERGMSASTLEGYRSVYNSFYGWLFREGLIRSNPMANLAVIKKPKVVRHPYSAEELARLTEAADKLRDRAIIAFLASTGCRISEVCSINREDLDSKAQSLIVLGKGNKQRRVWCDEVAAMRLRLYLETRTDDNPALFIGKGNERLKPGGVRSMLKKIGARAGVDNVHPHRFRRTRATSLIDKGMPIQEVATILGHDKLDTTMRYIFINEANVAADYRKYA